MRTRPWTSRIRSASRTVVRLMFVWSTSARSGGSGVPSSTSPRSIRSRRSLARASDALGSCIGARRTRGRSGAESAVAGSVTSSPPSGLLVVPNLSGIGFRAGIAEGNPDAVEALRQAGGISGGAARLAHQGGRCTRSGPGRTKETPLRSRRSSPRTERAQGLCWSVHAAAAVDAEDLPGDETGVLPGQERNCRGHLVGLGAPPDRAHGDRLTPYPSQPARRRPP